MPGLSPKDSDLIGIKYSIGLGFQYGDSNTLKSLRTPALPSPHHPASSLPVHTPTTTRTPRIAFAQSEAWPGRPQAPRERNGGVHIARHWDFWGTGSHQRIPPKSPKSLSPGSYRCLAEQASVSSVCVRKQNTAVKEVPKFSSLTF